MLFKTTDQILNDQWQSSATPHAPDNYAATKTKKSLDDDYSSIELWEEVYFLPGTIGVYVAAQPKTELYLIAFNLFAKYKGGIKIYCGENAADKVNGFCSRLGINLNVGQVWVD